MIQDHQSQNETLAAARRQHFLSPSQGCDAVANNSLSGPLVTPAFYADHVTRGFYYEN